jgi:hypothetical protein
MPFHGISDITVSVMVSRGERPPKPQQFDAPGISPAVWKVAKTCWQKRAGERPEAKEVLRDLEKIANLGRCTLMLPFMVVKADRFTAEEGSEQQAQWKQRLRDIFD